MSVNALESQGVQIKIGDGASAETFTLIPEASNINPFQGSAAEIDVTDLQSTAKEFRMGLQDWGQTTFTINWRPKHAQHALLWTAKGDRQSRNFQLVLTDASPETTYQFAAYVTALNLSIGVDGVVVANVTLRHTGDITSV